MFRRILKQGKEIKNDTVDTEQEGLIVNNHKLKKRFRRRDKGK